MIVCCTSINGPQQNAAANFCRSFGHSAPSLHADLTVRNTRNKCVTAIVMMIAHERSLVPCICCASTRMLCAHALASPQTSTGIRQAESTINTSFHHWIGPAYQGIHGIFIHSSYTNSLMFPESTESPQTQLHKSNYTNPITQIQLHKSNYTKSIQLHKMHWFCFVFPRFSITQTV